MNNFRSNPLSENPASAWNYRLTRTINAQNVVAGSGVDMLQHSGGTLLSVPDSIHLDRMVYQGTFDIKAEYKPGDVVSVVPTVTYTDYLGRSIPFGSTAQSGSAIIPINVGCFVCVEYVPPAYCSESYLRNTISKMFPNAIPQRYLEGTRYYEYNVYYPIYPEIPTQYTSSIQINIVGSQKYNLIANQVYWRALAGTIPMSICLDPVAKTKTTAYMCGYLSGSQFRNDLYLPYHA